jgi:hypothetical protein
MLALTARATIHSPMLLLLTSSLSLSELFVTAMTMMMRFCCVVRSRKKLELALDARNWKCFTKSPKYKEKALREKLLKKKKKKKKTAESSKFLCKCGRPKERAFGLSFAHTTTEFLISELLSLLDCVHRHFLPGFFQRPCNHCNTVMIYSLLLLLLLSSGATSP